MCFTTQATAIWAELCRHHSAYDNQSVNSAQLGVVDGHTELRLFFLDVIGPTPMDL